ncbi:hypothetical protein GYMLUDRAFT_803288 [Collybiopsis luxurians FD-317 M1]|nr:hypothetical protein GYMLUDRAFT_803288 [Collybiopsis luxurians FD-317 M1]
MSTEHSNGETNYPAHLNSAYTRSGNNRSYTSTDPNVEDRMSPAQQVHSAYMKNAAPRPVSQVPLDPSDFAQRPSISTASPGHHYDKFSFSSYQHPAEIPPPPNTYPGSGAAPSASPSNRPRRLSFARSVSFAQDPALREYEPEEEQYDPEEERANKRRGIPSQMLDLYALNREMKSQHSDHFDDFDNEDRPAFRRPNFRHADSMLSTCSEVMDEDDPRVTGIRAEHLEDPHDIEKNTLRQMDYRTRRKHLMRVKIEFNVTCKLCRVFVPLVLLQ